MKSALLLLLLLLLTVVLTCGAPYLVFAHGKCIMFPSNPAHLVQCTAAAAAAAAIVLLTALAHS
jgi:hypothetical protein